MFTNDRALVRHDFPFAVFQKMRTHHLGMAVDFRTPHPGTGSHGMGGTGRISMPVSRGVKAHLDVIHHQQWMNRFDFVRVDQVTFNIEVIQDALDVTKPVDFILCQSQSDCPAAMPARGLTGFGFQSLVELGSFVMELGHTQPADEMGNQTCRMPGGTGRQLAFLNQHDIAPALFGQVVQQPGTQGAASNNDNPCVCFHLGSCRPGGCMTVSRPSRVIQQESEVCQIVSPI